jgi:hypothetical protein
VNLAGIRREKQTEKALFGGPQRDTVGASEAFRTVSQKKCSELRIYHIRFATVTRLLIPRFRRTLGLRFRVLLTGDDIEGWTRAEPEVRFL